MDETDNTTQKARNKAINGFFMAELRASIARAGVTDTEAARRVGVAQTQMSRWLRNDSVMAAPMFVRIVESVGDNPVAAFDRAVEVARAKGFLAEAAQRQSVGSVSDLNTAREEHNSKETRVDQALTAGHILAADINNYDELDDQPNPNDDTGA